MAVGDKHLFPGFLTPVLSQLFFPKPVTTFFSHASAEVRGENTPERKSASTGDRTHNHQVMSPILSPLSHPGCALLNWKSPKQTKFLQTKFIILIIFANISSQTIWKKQDVFVKHEFPSNGHCF